MANINKLEMASLLTSNLNISVKSSFFGLVQKVTYVPTGSPVRVIIKDYEPAQGSKLEKVLTAGDVAAAARQAGTIESNTIGNTRLEACVSADGRFAAVQLFRFALLRYEPVMQPRILEGNDAQAVADLIK